MGAHLRMMNESFFSIHGVPESINISKKPLCQNFHLFFFLQNFFKLYAILTRCQEYITWLVIHQTKPEFVGIHHAKGLRDRSTYKGETRHLKIYTNFWTPCTWFRQVQNRGNPWKCGPTNQISYVQKINISDPIDLFFRSLSFRTFLLIWLWRSMRST